MITSGLSYGKALDLLANNQRIQRDGWVSKDAYLFIVKGEAVEQAICDCYGDCGNNPLPVLDAIYMKTKDNKLVPWVASHSDSLATDWKIK